ncbi:MAG: glycosyltransferase family 4 protein [Anaerolineales bacterium]|nr:glycosyltransferase family 4 protein [Anaerolineales bacterium]GER80065.1 glycosyl transferase family 1 [Candidatus Denitrolinea symbiosum]
MNNGNSVLVIGNFLSVELGSRSVCEDFAERLVQAGWTVIATSRKTGRITRLLDMLWPVFSRRTFYQIAYVEVYSGLSFVWAELAVMLLNALRKPHILTLHGGNLPVFAARNPGRVRNLLKSATVVTAPSPYLQKAMQPYRQDILLLPNALDISRYSFRARVTPVSRLVWLRAFHHIYNPSLAPRVLALLANEFPDINLTMFGPDKMDGSFELTRKTAHDMGVQDKMGFPGAVPKERVPDVLQTGDIFLNTTNVDNTPVSVLEAMACGLCVVTTNVGGLPDLLEDGVDALLVPPDDSQAMANAIRRLLTEPALAEKLSVNARRKVEGFDWSVILPQWERLFTELIQDA